MIRKWPVRVRQTTKVTKVTDKSGNLHARFEIEDPTKVSTQIILRQTSGMGWVGGPLNYPEAAEDPGRQDLLEAWPLEEANTGSYQAIHLLQSTCLMWDGDRLLALAGSAQHSSMKASGGVTVKSLPLTAHVKHLKLRMGRPFFYRIGSGEFGR